MFLAVFFLGGEEGFSEHLPVNTPCFWWRLGRLKNHPMRSQCSSNHQGFGERGGFPGFPGGGVVVEVIRIFLGLVTIRHTKI